MKRDTEKPLIKWYKSAEPKKKMKKKSKKKQKPKRTTSKWTFMLWMLASEGAQQFRSLFLSQFLVCPNGGRKIG